HGARRGDDPRACVALLPRHAARRHGADRACGERGLRRRGRCRGRPAPGRRAWRGCVRDRRPHVPPVRAAPLAHPLGAARLSPARVRAGPAASPVTGLLELGLVFGRLSLLAFGGGLGILPEMERQAVEAHGWVSHREFVDAFALSQVTPGPGMLMVLVIGFRASGLVGALVAGLAMFGPTATLAAVIADRWSRLGTSPLVEVLRETLTPVAFGLLAAGCYTLVRVGVDGAATGALALGALVVAGWVRSPALII